jgi:hypothetical protein
MNIYTKNKIEEAIGIIDEYIKNRHRWDDKSYEIGVYSKNAASPVITFIAYHNDDRIIETDANKPIETGGGKSLSIEMNMDTMTMGRELHFQ